MPLRKRSIVQCSKEGEDIRAFPSASEACLSLGRKNKDKIYKAIKYGFVAYRYRWRYLDQALVELQSYDMRNKPILGTKDGVVTRYPSIILASKTLGISISSIQQAILTGGKAKGYLFHIEGEEPKPIARRNSPKKGIEVLDEDGHILKEYPSAKDASIDLGVIPSAIYCAVNPKNKNARCKGYKLRYKE